MADDEPPTLEEVSRQFELTRQKIREIEERARRDLPRKPPGGEDPGSAPPAAPTRH